MNEADIRILAALRGKGDAGLQIDALAACCHDTAENVTATAERLFMAGVLGQWRRPHGPAHYYLCEDTAETQYQLTLPLEGK